MRPAPLHSTADEHAMADGEADTVVNTGMVLGTSPIKTKCTGMIYKA